MITNVLETVQKGTVRKDRAEDIGGGMDDSEPSAKDQEKTALLSHEKKMKFSGEKFRTKGSRPH